MHLKGITLSIIESVWNRLHCNEVHHDALILCVCDTRSNVRQSNNLSPSEANSVRWKEKSSLLEGSCSCMKFLAKRYSVHFVQEKQLKSCLNSLFYPQCGFHTIVQIILL